MKKIILTFNKHLNSKSSQNAMWLIFDRIVRLGIGLFISIYLTRFLGPIKFGIWNYVIAICSLLSIFSTLGMDSVIVRDLVEKKFSEGEILGTSFIMRFIGGILVMLLSMLWIFLFDKFDKFLLLYVLITSTSYLFLAFEVTDFYFQSKVNSKVTVKGRIVALLVATIPRIIGIILKFDMAFFMMIATIEIILSSSLLVIFYSRLSTITIFNWRFNKSFLLLKLKQLFPLILSGMVIMIYMRIDQIMIKHYIDEKAVGLYSAAVRISEIWYFIPLSIVSSYFPGLIHSKDNEDELRKKLNKLYRYLFLLSTGFALAMSLFSGFIIFTLYGKAFTEAGNILKINAWTGIFVSLGVASNSYFLIKNELKLTLYRTIFGVVVNILLNILLIPTTGISGAAFATLISYAVSAYFSTWFFKNSRRTFFDITKSCTINLFKNNPR